MKKLLYFVCLSLITCTLTSCDFFSNSPEEDNAEYYVRYTIKSTYPYIFSDITYADVYDNGTLMNYQTRNWTVTIGPVKKGFHAHVKNAKGTATDYIEVSKNGGPFAQKATGSNQASYYIR